MLISHTYNFFVGDLFISVRMATGSKVECDSMRVEACILLCLSVLRCTQKAVCAHKLQLHGSVASISGCLEYNAARTFFFVDTFFLSSVWSVNIGYINE